MAIFGFICGVLILSLLTLGLVTIFIFDGSLGGKREVPFYWILCAVCLLSYWWYYLVGASPFAITMTT